jgi:hypothetical protein
MLTTLSISKCILLTECRIQVLTAASGSVDDPQKIKDLAQRYEKTVYDSATSKVRHPSHRCKLKVIE